MDAHELEPDEEIINAELVEPELVEAELVLESADGEGLPVLATPRTLARVASIPAVQAVAVAATGFVAGAATLALMRRYGLRRAASTEVALRTAQGAGRPRAPEPGAASERTYLVHVRLIPSNDRD